MFLVDTAIKKQTALIPPTICGFGGSYPPNHDFSEYHMVGFGGNFGDINKPFNRSDKGLGNPART